MQRIKKYIYFSLLIFNNAHRHLDLHSQQLVQAFKKKSNNRWRLVNSQSTEHREPRVYHAAVSQMHSLIRRRQAHWKTGFSSDVQGGIVQSTSIGREKGDRTRCTVRTAFRNFLLRHLPRPRSSQLLFRKNIPRWTINTDAQASRSNGTSRNRHRGILGWIDKQVSFWWVSSTERRGNLSNSTVYFSYKTLLIFGKLDHRFSRRTRLKIEGGWKFQEETQGDRNSKVGSDCHPLYLRGSFTLKTLCTYKVISIIPHQHRLDEKTIERMIVAGIRLRRSYTYTPGSLLP